MIDVSRRSFLKGAMASAGLVAVGIPLDQVNATPVSRPVLLEVDEGELWLKIDEMWRFIGRAVEWGIETDTYERPDLIIPDTPEIVATGYHLIDVKVVGDKEGLTLARKTILGRDAVETIIGVDSGQFHIKRATLMNVAQDLSSLYMIEYRFGMVAGPITYSEVG